MVALFVPYTIMGALPAPLRLIIVGSRAMIMYSVGRTAVYVTLHRTFVCTVRHRRLDLQAVVVCFARVLERKGIWNAYFKEVNAKHVPKLYRIFLCVCKEFSFLYELLSEISVQKVQQSRTSIHSLIRLKSSIFFIVDMNQSSNHSIYYKKKEKRAQ